MSSSTTGSDSSNSAIDRRGFLTGPSVAMAVGLTAGYGTLIAMAGRFLYPSDGQAKAWMYVAGLKGFAPGDSITFIGPTGAEIVIARQGEKGTVDDFIALSTVCPHLGCQVHWDAQDSQFICPCHNGIFDAEGTAIEGPPAAAGQVLPRYPLQVENGLLFIEVPVESVAQRDGRRGMA